MTDAHPIGKKVIAECEVPALPPVSAYIVSHRQHLHGRLDTQEPGQLPLVETETLFRVGLFPAHSRCVFLSLKDQVGYGPIQSALDQHLHLPGVDGVGGQVGDKIRELDRIPPGAARPVLPMVEVSAVLEEGVALQNLPVQDGVGLMLVKRYAPPLKGLLDPLPSAQMVPLVGNNGFFIEYLVIRLHHLSFDKPVTAGAPGGGPGGEGGVIFVFLPQCQSVGVESVSSGVEKNRQFPLGQ